MRENVRDLRSALALLREMDGQLIETHVEVEPKAELAGVYRYVGAGGTVKRPTKEGPAMIFHNVKGHPDAKVVIGVLASRKRVAALLELRRRIWEAACTAVWRRRSRRWSRRGRRPARRWCTGPRSRILTYTS